MCDLPYVFAPCSKGEAVEVNLGAKPYMFDLDKLVAADRAAQGEAVEGCVRRKLIICSFFGGALLQIS